MQERSSYFKLDCFDHFCADAADVSAVLRCHGVDGADELS